MQRSVLIVDDDAQLRRVLVDFLQKENWQTHEAADGIEALKAVTRYHPSIIILGLPPRAPDLADPDPHADGP